MVICENCRELFLRWLTAAFGDPLVVSCPRCGRWRLRLNREPVAA